MRRYSPWATRPSPNTPVVGGMGAAVAVAAAMSQWVVVEAVALVQGVLVAVRVPADLVVAGIRVALAALAWAGSAAPM